MKRFFFYLLLLSVLAACGPDRGKFAFFPADLSKLDSLQKKNFHPLLFKVYRDPVLFPQHSTLWFSYEPASPQWGKVYAISLSAQSLGFIEIDLKNRTLDPQVGFLKDYYEDLPVGKYLLRIAHENKVIDQIQFEIIAEEKEESIDYEAPIPEEQNSKQAEEDDILLLSK